MATTIRDTNWINDRRFGDTLRKLVGDNLKRTKTLGYMQHDFPESAWSLCTETDVSDILISTKRTRMSQ